MIYFPYLFLAPFLFEFFVCLECCADSSTPAALLGGDHPLISARLNIFLFGWTPMDYMTSFIAYLVS